MACISLRDVWQKPLTDIVWEHFETRNLMWIHHSGACPQFGIDTAKFWMQMGWDEPVAYSLYKNWNKWIPLNDSAFITAHGRIQNASVDQHHVFRSHRRSLWQILSCINLAWNSPNINKRLMCFTQTQLCIIQNNRLYVSKMHQNYHQAA